MRRGGITTNFGHTMKCIRTLRPAESFRVPLDELETRPLTVPGQVILTFIYEEPCRGFESVASGRRAEARWDAVGNGSLIIGLLGHDI
jgi:hypothetical protein